MVTFFKYSTTKFPPLFSLSAAVGLQVAGAIFVAAAFQGVGIYLGKVVAFAQIVFACNLGLSAGFFLVALRTRPLAGRQVAFVSVSSLVSGVLYWLVSASQPDLWLSHVIASLGIGVGMAAIYRLVFFNTPVIPRVK